jgi:hypothetical protein
MVLLLGTNDINILGQKPFILNRILVREVNCISALQHVTILILPFANLLLFLVL